MMKSITTLVACFGFILFLFTSTTSGLNPRNRAPPPVSTKLGDNSNGNTVVSTEVSEDSRSRVQNLAGPATVVTPTNKVQHKVRHLGQKFTYQSS